MEITAVYKDDIHNILNYIKTTPEWCNGDYSWTFNYDWSNSKYPYGFVLKDDNRIVGFLGTIYADREINDNNVTYCNLATWIVDKEYRTFASILLKKAITKEVIITNFTPNDNVVKILERMKFKHLNASHSVSSNITPFTIMSSLNSRYELMEANDNNINILSNKDKKIYDDHKDKPCKCLLIVDKKGLFKPLLLVLFKSIAKGFSVANIAYSTDNRVLAEIWSNIAIKILLKTKCLFSGEFVIDLPIIKTKFRMVKPQNMLVYNQVYSTDFIYSELILTNKYKWK